MPRLTEAEREARRGRVLDGARRCFARHGYEGATVRRLEQEIGLSRGAIFNWFPTKEDLFFELAVRDNDRLVATFVEEGIEGIVRELLAEDPDWLGVYLELARRIRADAEFRQRWEERGSPDVRERSRARIAEEQAAGRIRDDVPRKAVGDFLGVVLDGITVQRAFGFEPLDADTLLRLLGDALAGRTDAPRRG